MKKLQIILSLFLAGTSYTFSQSISDSLVAFYPFNSATSFDESGNNNHAIIFGATPTIDRFNETNNAFYFDGLIGSIELPSDFDFQERTWVVWFNSSSISTTIKVIMDSDNPNLQNGKTAMDVQLASGVPSLNYNIGDGSPATKVTTPINLNQWYMASISVGSDTTKMYLNDQLVGQRPNSLINSLNGDSVAHIGKSRINDRYFQGLIDDIRIYNRSLNATEISTLYNLPGDTLQSCFDTTYIDIFDTTFVTVFDTVPVFDTTFITVYDTLTVFDTLTIFDTTFITVYDTVPILNNDTLFITLTDLGVLQNENSLIKIYPNPTATDLHIDISNQPPISNYTIRISKVPNQVVYFGSFSSPFMTIDMSNFGAGQYWVEIRGDNLTLATYYRRIIIQ